MDIYIIITVLLLLGHKVSANCDSYKNCKDCTSHKSWTGANCRWCPLDRECHAHGSTVNSCRIDQNIKSPSGCSSISKTYGVYNHELSYSATLLSAVAYSDTPMQCMSSIYSDGGFELIHAIGRRCENLPLFEYEECYAYTAISHKRKLIVLAYRGTTTTSGNEQLHDEIVSVLTIPKTSFIIGGEVQYYFKQAYDKLFPCIQSSIEELTDQYPDYDVLVTGHSLGGAIASLTAASLIYKGIVPENKLSLYTFGMPRVGDKGYAFNHDKIVNNSWRVVHNRDIVAHLPTCHLLLGCRVTADGPYHHRSEIFYRAIQMTKDSKYEHCNGNEDERCSNGLISSNLCVPFVDLKDCIEYHKHYFSIPVGTYCNEKGHRKKRGASERSLMWDKFSSEECRKIDLSKELPGNLENGNNKKSTTNDAAYKVVEISMIYINLMIFVMLMLTIF